MSTLDRFELERALDVAQEAARRAGELQRAGMRRAHQVEFKGAFNLVTEVDRQCEQAILEILRRGVPGAAVLAEESRPDTRSEGLLWVIDPLDGTTNYTHGYPFFCCSIALIERGRPVLGAVYEPLRDEMFSALRGRGAWRNGEDIRVSQTRELECALLATGFPYDRREQPETNLDRFCLLSMRTRGVRRGGSAAMDLCMTACGRLDGYWEIRLSPWDVVAGALIVEEAGGKVTDLSGRPYDWSGAETLASNGLIHPVLIEALAEKAPHGRCFG